MAPPILYGHEASPPVRSVLLTAKALELELDLKVVNLLSGAHKTPEFLKMNPQHTIPTLDDNGYYLWDSHAINIYLVSKYGKNDTLYPKDLQKKGVVDQRLFFNVGVIQPINHAIAGTILTNKTSFIPKEKSDELIVAYDFLEAFLGSHEYMAGDSLTIADFCIVANLSAICSIVPITEDKHPCLSKWLCKMKQLPYYTAANEVGSNMLVAFLKLNMN